MKTVDKKHVRTVAKKMGFSPLGDFLIGNKNDQIISGLSIDRTPSSMYIWNFVLPAFDEIEFMHMTLGKRFGDGGVSNQDLDKILCEAWRPVSSITTADNLLDYIYNAALESEYAYWAQFICLIRIGRTDEADKMINSIELLKSAGIPHKTRQIKSALSNDGWKGVRELLKIWSLGTERIIGPNRDMVIISNHI